jgi:hypothetical protein
MNGRGHGGCNGRGGRNDVDIGMIMVVVVTWCCWNRLQ